VSAASGATFTVEGGTRVHRAGEVVSVGEVIDPETRTLPVLLAVPNPEGRLKLGMLAEARLLLGSPVRGVAIPAEAVQDAEGLKVAYVQRGGETFERRVLALGPGDGEWTIVLSGVEAGEKVVTSGAYQVRLASLSGGEAPAVGHGHPH
jgi:multidrug efflux pump subunit AcrA (membrane-fusion protein)